MVDWAFFSVRYAMIPSCFERGMNGDEGSCWKWFDEDNNVTHHMLDMKGLTSGKRYLVLGGNKNKKKILFLGGVLEGDTFLALNSDQQSGVFL